MSLLNNALDILATKYSLSHDARALVAEFVNLKRDIQQVFVDYALKVARSIANGEPASDAVLQPDSPAAVPDEEGEYAPELEDEVERYRQKHRLERRTRTSGASTPVKTS